MTLKRSLVGALLVIGCATFMANSSNVVNKQRYEWISNNGLMLDTWEGKLYAMKEPNDKRKTTFMWYEVDEESNLK